VRPDEGDRLTGGHAVHHSKTGEGGTGPAAPAAAGDLHPFHIGLTPRLTQRVPCVVVIAG
jgi:hypothetical protein